MLSKEERIIYDEYHNKHYTEIKSYCYCWLRSSEVEDCCQSTFFDLYKALDKGNEILNIRAWLYKVAKRNVQKTIEKRPNAISSNDGKQLWELSYTIDFLDEIKFESDAETIEYIRKKIKKRDRELFDSLVQKISNEEIAENFGVSIEALYMKKSRLRKKIAKILEARER